MAGDVHGRHVTRRAALRALGGSALAASSAGIAACQAPAKQAAVTATGRSDDDLIRDRAIAASRRLEAGIRAALAVHPDLAGRLAPVLAYHERHVTVLAAGYRQPPPASPSPRASGTTRTPAGRATATGTPTPPPATTLATGTAVPSNPSAALAAIADAEQAASDGRTHDILAASGDLARLLASVAACEAVAARTLGGSP